MARSLAAASSQYLSQGSAVLTAEPLTIAAWVNLASLGTARSIVSIMLSSASVNFTGWELRVQTANTIQATSNDTGAGSNATTSTAIAGTGAWHHAAGVFTSTISRAAYLDGGGKGTNGTAKIVPATADTTLIGAAVNVGSHFRFWDGQIAEVGVWNIALSDTDIAALAAGVSPRLIHPEALVAYWPLIGQTSPEIELKNHKDMTIVAGATQAAHPRILYAPNTKKIFAPQSAGTTNVLTRTLMGAGV